MARVLRPEHFGDLREVAGYEAACLRSAHQFLREARSLGLTRIALVASSSVMRTASRLAASSLPVELRTFEHEPSAARWLGRPHPSRPVSRFGSTPRRSTWVSSASSRKASSRALSR